MQTIIELFLENTTKGSEKRANLFHQVSQEIYLFLYKDKMMEDFEQVLGEYVVQMGYFADDFYDFKNMMTFLIEKNQRNYKSDFPYDKFARGLFVNNVDFWFDKIGLENMSNEEAHCLYRLQNNIQI
jgi:hypothetical protein